MEIKEIHEKLAVLKNDYLAIGKKYREYAKCVNQYELFLRRLYSYVCRLLVDKEYNVINNETYFKEESEFNLDVAPLDFSIDLCEMINDFLDTNAIGSLIITPSKDNTQPFRLTIKFDSLKKIPEVERKLSSLKDEETEVMMRK